MLFSLQKCNLDAGKVGPIGLSITDVLSECYLQRIKRISITQALILNLAPKTFKRFVDDSNARFNNRETYISVFRHPGQ